MKFLHKEIHCRAEFIKTDLRQNLGTSSSNYKNFEQTFFVLLDKHAPYKRKKIQANKVPYITKNLRKAIMKRSQLKTKYFTTNIEKVVIIQEAKKNLYK